MVDLHFPLRMYTESQRRPLCLSYIAPIRTESEEGLNEERVGVQLYERQFSCHEIMFQTLVRQPLYARLDDGTATCKPRVI